MSQSEEKLFVWHDDPNFEKVVTEIIDLLKPDFFIETGTYKAETIRWVARKWPKLIVASIDINPNFVGAARESCKNDKNINLYYGDSRIFLQSIIPFLKPTLPFFELDAHWYADWPLQEECKLVSTLDRYIVLIDDFEIPNTKFGFDEYPPNKCNLPYIAESLGVYFAHVPNYEPKEGYRGYSLYFKGLGDFNPYLDQIISQNPLKVITV
jgi:hypothetical protein